MYIYVKTVRYSKNLIDKIGFQIKHQQNWIFNLFLVGFPIPNDAGWYPTGQTNSLSQKMKIQKCAATISR